MPQPKPRTMSEFLALPLAERLAEFARWLSDAEARTAEAEARYLSGDYDRVGSNRRYEVGE